MDADDDACMPPRAASVSSSWKTLRRLRAAMVRSAIDRTQHLYAAPWTHAAESTRMTHGRPLLRFSTWAGRRTTRRRREPRPLLLLLLLLLVMIWRARPTRTGLTGQLAADSGGERPEGRRQDSRGRRAAHYDGVGNPLFRSKMKTK